LRRYPKWIKLDASRQPKKWIKDGMSLPLTIKIQWSSCNGHKMSCNITPDKGLFGPAYTLAYIILHFEMKLLMHWDKDHTDDEDNANKKFDYRISQCIGTTTL
jgi:hypothetical protein